MYTLVQKKGRSLANDTFDYVFSGFEPFYEIASVLTMSLHGSYSIRVDTDDVKATMLFIKESSKYEHLNVSIYMPEAAIDYIQQYNTTVNISGVERDIDIFKKLVSNMGVLFSSGALYTLYRSINHSASEMEEALRKVCNEFGTGVTITEKMLGSIFVLNKTVYPREVALSFIAMERYRWSKLEKCVEQMGNDIVTGAITKNVKQFVENKVAYYKTGSGSFLTKEMNTANLMLMYRVFVTERNALDDVRLLLILYERGLSIYDFLYKEES